MSKRKRDSRNAQQTSLLQFFQPSDQPHQNTLDNRVNPTKKLYADFLKKRIEELSSTENISTVSNELADSQVEYLPVITDTNISDNPQDENINTSNLGLQVGPADINWHDENTHLNHVSDSGLLKENEQLKRELEEV